jgi:FMN phosphatase YigB (HAD superfamily)
MGGPRLRYLILDLDDTLYPRRSGVMDLVNQRIGRYMVERLGFPRSRRRPCGSVTTPNTAPPCAG